MSFIYIRRRADKKKTIAKMSLRFKQSCGNSALVLEWVVQSVQNGQGSWSIQSFGYLLSWTHGIKYARNKIV